MWGSKPGLLRHAHPLVLPTQLRRQRLPKVIGKPGRHGVAGLSPLVYKSPSCSSCLKTRFYTPPNLAQFSLISEQLDQQEGTGRWPEREQAEPESRREEAIFRGCVGSARLSTMSGWA
jgi:hypothetical protein